MSKRKRSATAYYCDITNYEWYHWVDSIKRWMTTEQYHALPKRKQQGYSTNYYGYHTQKEFHALLREWAEYLPAGLEFVLCSRYKGWPDYRAKIPRIRNTSRLSKDTPPAVRTKRSQG